MLEFLPSFERSVLSRLGLNASEAARVCSITPRQLKYWTRKGHVPTIDDSEQCYGFPSLERAVLIKEAMSHGHTLDTAGRIVTNTLAEVAEEERKLDALSEEDLRNAITGFMEQVERRIAILLVELPNYLTLFHLGESALPVDRGRLERFFRENPYSFDTAEGIALRVGHTTEEVQRILEDLTGNGVLVKNGGDVPVYQLRRTPNGGS